MALCIRNRLAEELARDLARQTGKGITQALVEALEHELQRRKGRVRAPRLEADILAVSRRCASLPDLDTRPPDQILGYDRQGGLPPSSVSMATRWNWQGMPGAAMAGAGTPPD